MKNLLYGTPPLIKNPKGPSWNEWVLPFVCNKIIDDEKDFFLIGKEGRVVARDGFSEHRFLKNYSLAGSLNGENFAALSQEGEIGIFYQDGRSFYRTRSPDGKKAWFTKKDSLLQATENGVLLFQKENTNLLYHEKMTSTFAPWKEGGEDIISFLPGIGGALLVRNKKSPTLYFLSSDLSLKKIGKAFPRGILFTPGHKKDSLYLVEEKTVSEIDFIKGRKNHLLDLSGKPYKIRKSKNGLVFFYSNDLEVISKKGSFRKSLPPGHQDAACVNDTIITLWRDRFLSFELESHLATINR